MDKLWIAGSLLCVLLGITVYAQVYSNSGNARRGPPICSCVDCITKSFCYGIAKNNNSLDAAIKLIMKELQPHGLVNHTDLDGMHHVNTTSLEMNTCLMRKIELTTAFLFDLPLTESRYECHTGHICNQDLCFASLTNITTWTRFNSRCEDVNVFTNKRDMMNLYFHVMKPTLLTEIKTRAIANRYNFAEYTHAVLNITDSSCPAQTSLSSYHYIRMALQLTMTAFNCEKHGVKFYEESSYGCDEPIDIHNDAADDSEIYVNDYYQDFENMFNTTAPINTDLADRNIDVDGIEYSCKCKHFNYTTIYYCECNGMHENGAYYNCSSTCTPQSTCACNVTDNYYDYNTGTTISPENDSDDAATTTATPESTMATNVSYENATMGTTLSSENINTTASSSDITTDSSDNVNTTSSSRRRRAIYQSFKSFMEVENRNQSNGERNNSSVMIHRNQWRDSPIPRDSSLANQRIKLLNWINFAVMGYRPADVSCDDKHGRRLKAKCGPFRDRYTLSKNALLDQMYRYIVGCSNCSRLPDPDITGNCGHISLQKYGVQYEWRRLWMEKIQSSILDCKAYDKVCMERKIRDIPKESFLLAFEMLKNVVGCKRSCHSLIVPKLELPNPGKYLLLPVIAGMSQTCDANEITGGGLQSGDRYNYKVKSEVESARQLRTVQSNTEDNQRIAQRRELRNTIKYVLQAKMLYKMLHLVLSLPEPQNYTLNSWTESNCLSWRQLQDRRCEPYVRKHQAKLFSSFLGKITSCAVNESLPGSLNFCKNNIFETDGECMLAETPTVIMKSDESKQAELVQRLSNIMFTGCVDTARNDPFSSAVMRCSYYYVVLGQTSPRSGVFRRREAIDGFEEMKNVYPQLFNATTDELVRIRTLYRANGCPNLCPNRYRYCQATRTCSPSWLSCDQSSRNMDSQMLPPMVSTSNKSEVINVTTLSTDNSIVIINKYDEMEKYGGWQYNHNGRWSNLSSIALESGVKLDSGSYIRYFQSESQYGLRKLYYLHDDDSNNEVGKVVLPQSSTGMKIAFMLIHPEVVRSNFTVSNYSDTYILNEDDTGEDGGILLSDLVTVNVPIERIERPIPQNFVSMIPLQKRIDFETNVTKFINHRPLATITQNFRQFGKLKLEVIGLNGQKQQADVNRLNFDNSYAKLVFIPQKDISGNFTIEIVVYDAVDNIRPPVTLNISVAVLPVNDPPKLASTNKKMLPSIAYNLTSQPNTGFTVAELISLYNVNDPESGTNIGIAIAKYSGDNVGTWQYNNNGAWRNLNFTNGNNEDPKRFFRGKRGLTQNVFLANGNVSFRLKLQDTDVLWRRSMAKPYILISFWDFSDGLSDGYHELTSADFISSQAYTRSFYAYMFRKGCDNKVGSVAREDQCGVCGGDGQIGCDGAFCSTARYDRCGECTGGVTNKTFNYLLDCNKRCGKYQLGTCGKCQRKDKTRDFRDCTGTCFGQARVDTCSVCDGGDRTLDICNVCNGNNSTCGGCSRKAGKRIDQCNQCLLPTNRNFNALCFKINSMEPKAASSAGGEVVTIYGAGFLLNNLACSFVSSTEEKFPANMVQGSRLMRQMQVTTPSMASGRYKLECRDGHQTQRIARNFKVYDGNTIQVFNVTPSQIPINNAVNLTIKGNGFQDTGEIQCLVLAGGRLYEIDGNYVNETTVKCLLPAVRKSAHATVALSFTKRSWTVSKFNRLSLGQLGLRIYAPAPALLAAKMQNDYRHIVLNFSSIAKKSEKSCANVFSTETNSLLGNHFTCSFRSSTDLYIKLGSSATIRPNDVITLKADVIKTRAQPVVDFTPETNVTLIAPDLTLSPIAYLSGQRELGVCDRLRLSGLSTGSGGRRLKYYWNVTFANSVDTGSLHSNVTTGLTTLKNKLDILPSKTNRIVLEADDLATGVSYNFSLYVENYLHEVSEYTYHEVTRKSTYLPQVRVRGGTKQTIGASRLAKIQTRARKPSCMTGENDLDFLWELDDTSVTLDETSSTKSNLYIEPGTLSGGKVYTLNVTVSLKDDPSITVTVSIELTVTSTPLIAKIKGGKRRAIGSGKKIVLDGSKSHDPDQSSDDSYYTWECEDQSGVACFVLNTTSNQYTELSMDSVANVEIAGGNLESNNNYTFTLNYRKGSRTASDTTEVSILQGSPPVVEIKTQRTTKENVEKFVVVHGNVQSEFGNMKIWFECADEDEYAYIDLSDENVLLTPVEVYGVGKGNRPVGMVFDKNVLESGVSYKFITYAEQSEGIGYSEVIITTNAPPSIGLLEADAENGTALETEFTLTAVEGWEDDADDLPLFYNFGYLTKNGKRRFLGSPSIENSLTIVLPAGDPDNNDELVVFVMVSDIHGSKSETQLTLTVRPAAAIDAAAITNIMGNIDGAITAGDVSSTLGLISSSLNTFDASAPVFNESMDADELDNYNEVTEKLLEMKENITKSVLAMADTVMDEETQTIIIDTMSDMTKGANFTDTTKIGVANTLADIVRKQMGTYQTTPSSRRRRNTPSSDVSEVGKDADEIEKILLPYENTITASDMDNATMTAKHIFTELTTDLLIAMCRDIVFGQPAVLAQSGIANLQSVNNLFVNVSETSDTIDLNCGANCTLPTKVVLGSALETMYSSWSCGSENCTGACIGSVNYVHDLFSTLTDRTVITDVVSITLIDPEQFVALTPGLLDSPLRLEIPLRNEGDTSNYYVCQSWDDDNSLWSSDYCSAEEDTLVRDSQSYVVCQCNKTGIVSVIAGSERPIATTVITVTETSTIPYSETSGEETNGTSNATISSTSPPTEETVTTQITSTTMESTTPTEGPSTSTQEPTTLTEEPTTLTEEPTTPTEEPTTPTEEPTTPTQEPTTEKPTTEATTSTVPPSTTTTMSTTKSTPVPTTTPLSTTTAPPTTTEPPTTTVKPTTTSSTTTRAPPSTTAEVTLVFKGDFNETLRKVGGLANLEAGMKIGIVAALNVSEWRVQNVSCKSGSIITTFQFLPPDENQVLDARGRLEDDIKRLVDKAKSGDLTIKIGNNEIKIDPTKEIDTKYYDNGVETGESRVASSRTLLPTGSLITLFLALAVKYNF